MMSNNIAKGDELDAAELEGLMDLPLKPQHRTRPSASESLKPIIPWTITLISFTILLLNLLHSSCSPVSSSQCVPGQSQTISSLFNPPFVNVRFQGSPHFHANGSEYIPRIDTSLAYPQNTTFVGAPTAELDDAWATLGMMNDFKMSITEEEAREAWGERADEYKDVRTGGWSAGLDVLHGIHCLNELRKTLDPTYTPIGIHGKLHTDHCIDYIRQSLLCYGSTTLIPIRYFDGIKHGYIDSDQVHTCRDYSAILTWVSERQEGKVNGDR